MVTDLKNIATDFFSRGGQRMLRDHPVPSLLLIPLSIILTCLFFRERMTNYELIIADLQRRTGETSGGTKYATWTNRALTNEAYRLAEQLREFGQEVERRKRARTLASIFPSKEEAARSEAEKQKAYQQQTREDIEFGDQWRQEYQRIFSGKVAALGEALRQRLPYRSKHARTSLEDITLVHQSLTGPDPVGNIATNLEKLANLLPPPSEGWFSMRWQDWLFTFAVLTSVTVLALRQLAKRRWEKTQRSILLLAYTAVLAASNQNTDVQQNPPRSPRRAR